MATTVDLGRALAVAWPDRPGSGQRRDDPGPDPDVGLEARTLELEWCAPGPLDGQRGVPGACGQMAMAGELAGDGRLWIVGCGPLGPRPALGPFQLQAMANLAVVPGGQATGPVVAGQVAALRAFGGRVGMVVLGADRCLGRELERRYRSVVWTVGHRDGRPVRLGGLPWRGVVADIIRWLTTPPQPPRRYRLPGAPDGLLSSSGRRYPAPAHRPGGRP